MHEDMPDGMLARYEALRERAIADTEREFSSPEFAEKYPAMSAAFHSAKGITPAWKAQKIADGRHFIDTYADDRQLTPTPRLIDRMKRWLGIGVQA